MAILKIAQLGHPILLANAEPIPTSEISSPQTQQLVDDMIETLNETGGVGLAAPQVYQSKRMILLQSKPTKDSFRHVEIPTTIIINPEIIIHSDEQELDWEACLSIVEAGIRALVPRYKTVTVQGYDRNGKEISIEAKSFHARVLQHEIDHLNGILFFERMRHDELKQLAETSNWTKYHRENWPEPQPL